MKNSLRAPGLPDNLLRSVSISLICTIIYAIWLSHSPFITTASLPVYDRLYKFSLFFHPAVEILDRVNIIAIDDGSLKRINKRWPWPRDIIAQVINSLSSCDPAVICVDLVFAGKSTDPRHDLMLAEALKKTSNIVVAYYYGKDMTPVLPEQTLAENASAIGFVNKPRDMDNKIRRMRPFSVTDIDILEDFSMGVKAAALALNTIEEDIVLNMPLRHDNTTYIRYFGYRKQFRVIPVWKILENDFDPSLLKESLIFLGVTSEALHDTYDTPVGIIPGVLIGAHESLTYITRWFFSYSSALFDIYILFIFVLASALFSYMLPILKGISVVILELLLFLLISIYLLINSVIIDYATCLIFIPLTSFFIYVSRYATLGFENIRLRKEVITDGLTQLYSHNYFASRLDAEFSRAQRENKALSLAVFDVDYFKSVNDKYGHEFGNTVLKRMASIMQNNSRPYDIVARYGGEEFCILMPDVDPNDAFNLTERIWGIIRKTAFITSTGVSINVTISAGIASLGECVFAGPSDFIDAADVALYQSKSTGRDKVSVFKSEVQN